jgi:hypothetical protein
MPIWYVSHALRAIAPELAVHWWAAIDTAGAAIDAAELDRDLSSAQAGVKRRALLAERRWLERVSVARRRPLLRRPARAGRR